MQIVFLLFLLGLVSITARVHYHRDHGRLCFIPRGGNNGWEKEKAALMGIKEIDVVVKGVGSGRESVIRGFTAMSEIDIKRIQDKTPVPFNGTRAKKARRV